MADTDTLRAYRASVYPNVDGGLPTYVTDELRNLQQSIQLIIEVMKKLEARLVAGGL